MATDRVIFLIGTPESCERRTQEIETQLLKETGTLEKKIFYGPELSVETLGNEITGSSLFVENTLVVLKQAELLDKKSWQALENILARTPAHVWVVVESASKKFIPDGYPVEVIERQENPSAELFQILGRRSVSSRELCEIAMSFLKDNPYGFPLVLAAFEKHLQKALIAGDISENQFAEKISYLQDLDFRLKTGALSSAPGWEILLLRLIDSGR